MIIVQPKEYCPNILLRHIRNSNSKKKDYPYTVTTCGPSGMRPTHELVDGKYSTSVLVHLDMDGEKVWKQWAPHARNWAFNDYSYVTRPGGEIIPLIFTMMSAWLFTSLLGMKRTPPVNSVRARFDDGVGFIYDLAKKIELLNYHQNDPELYESIVKSVGTISVRLDFRKFNTLLTYLKRLDKAVTTKKIKAYELSDITAPYSIETENMMLKYPNSYATSHSDRLEDYYLIKMLIKVTNIPHALRDSAAYDKFVNDLNQKIENAGLQHLESNSIMGDKYFMAAHTPAGKHITVKLIAPKDFDESMLTMYRLHTGMDFADDYKRYIIVKYD